VAVAPFASTLPDTGEDHLDRFIASGLGGFLSGMAVPNPRVFGKATVIHSDDDRLVPPAKSEEFAAAIGACYREHVGPPSKPLKSQIRDLQRALGRAEVPGVPDELARLLAQEKEEGAEEGARKVKEDWGDVDEEAW